MEIANLSVSYLNDLDQKVEWLHPYFSSLSDVLNKNDSIDHYIVLNDYNKKKAKQNIQQVIGCYELDHYNSIFIEASSKNLFKYPSKRNDSSSSHGKALYHGLDEIRKNINLLKYDFFLLKELDLIHKENYFEELKDYIELSVEENFFITILENGGETVHAGREGIRLPRVIPSFFGFPRSRIKIFFNNIEKFKFGSYEETHLDKEYVTSNDSYDVFRDTGNELFYFLYKNASCIHVHWEFLEHIRGLSREFGKLLDFGGSIAENSFYTLQSRFEKVKSKDYLDFKDYSVFNQDDISSSLRTVMETKKSKLLK